MWKPTTVVPRHRKRANCLWMALLLVLVCYTLWEIRVVINKEKTPSTSYKVSNNLYAFPYVSICFYDGYGCYHPEGSTDECVTSALRFSDAEYDGETISAIEDEQYSNCVGFDLSQFEVPEGEREGQQENVLIVMYWVASEDPTAETEYGRNLESSEEEIYDITAMTIGKTTRTFLDYDPVVSYPALTVSTTKYVVPERSYQSAMWTGTNWTSPADTNATSPAADGDPTAANLSDDPATDDAPGTATDDATDDGASADTDFAYGMLYLTVAQGSYSLTEVDDIEPQVLGTLLGSIGGFWELLLLAWTVFFVTSRGERGEGGQPMMKARDFLAPLKKQGSSKPSRSKHQQIQPGQESPKGGGQGGEFDEEEDLAGHGFDEAAGEVEVDGVEYYE